MTTYRYRAELTRKELLPAVGLGVGAGLGVAAGVAYLAQLLMRRRALPSGAAVSAPPATGSR